MEKLTQALELPDGQRGKRRLGKQLILFVVILTFLGLKFDIAWIMAQFFTPYVFTMVGGLYLGDGYFHMKCNGNA